MISALILQFLIAKSSFEVLRVYDGDSLEIRNSEGFELELRISALDCPELSVKVGKMRVRKPEAFAQEAKELLEKLLRERSWRVEAFARDRYHRHLVEFLDPKELLLSEEMLKSGYCRVFRKGGDLPYQDRLEKAEKLAKTQKLGLWGAK